MTRVRGISPKTTRDTATSTAMASSIAEEARNAPTKRGGTCSNRRSRKNKYGSS